MCRVCSLLSLKVLIGIVLLGKAHESIDGNRESVRGRDAAPPQSSSADSKQLVSKDDLDLLSAARTSPTVSEAAALRRTQSLAEFVSAADSAVAVELQVNLNFQTSFQFSASVLISYNRRSAFYE